MREEMKITIFQAFIPLELMMENNMPKWANCVIGLELNHKRKEKRAFLQFAQISFRRNFLGNVDLFQLVSPCKWNVFHGCHIFSYEEFIFLLSGKCHHLLNSSSYGGTGPPQQRLVWSQRRLSNVHATVPRNTSKNMKIQARSIFFWKTAEGWRCLSKITLWCK